ncbi:MAG: hypothetical protein QOK10_3217, partial [Pseudonocardiales bacterium]|nr:hypothetical protein [Pseudonocardiales bacterium]
MARAEEQSHHRRMEAALMTTHRSPRPNRRRASSIATLALAGIIALTGLTLAHSADGVTAPS